MNAQSHVFKKLKMSTSTPTASRGPSLAQAAGQEADAPAISSARLTIGLKTRRVRKAGRLFDRHGTALHTFASILTKDPLHAETLVIDAICSQVALPPLTDQDTKQRSARKLAAATYAAWSCRPAPPTPTPAPAGIKSRSSTLTALHQLPDDHRAALALCSFGGHTYRQAASVLGLPAERVAILLREALLTLGRTPVMGLSS